MAKLSQLESFHPDRMASRILGMGDVLTMIEKAQAVVDEEKAAELEQKFLKNAFTLEDFRDQLIQVRKMGSLSDIMGMIPGMGKMKQMKNLQVDESELVRIEAIINSMTKEERLRYNIINGSRRKRIAKGSGTRVQDVNRLLKNYTQVMKMMKKLNKGGMRGLGRGMLRLDSQGMVPRNDHFIGSSSPIVKVHVTVDLSRQLAHTTLCWIRPK